MGGPFRTHITPPLFLPGMCIPNRRSFPITALSPFCSLSPLALPLSFCHPACPPLAPSLRGATSAHPRSPRAKKPFPRHQPARLYLSRRRGARRRPSFPGEPAAWPPPRNNTPCPACRYRHAERTHHTQQPQQAYSTTLAQCHFLLAPCLSAAAAAAPRTAQWRGGPASTHTHYTPTARGGGNSNNDDDERAANAAMTILRTSFCRRRRQPSLPSHLPSSLPLPFWPKPLVCVLRDACL